MALRPHEAVLLALRDTPKRIADGWRDPVRRRNSISRIAEGWVGGLAVGLLLGAGWWALLVAFAAPLAEFLFYEYLAEPMGWTSSYWERRDARFTRW